MKSEKSDHIIYKVCLGPFKLSNLVNSLFNFKSVSHWQLINFRLTTTTLPSTIKNPTETTRASALRDNPASLHLVLWTWYSPLQSGYRMFQKMDKNVCLQIFIQVSVRSSLFSNLLSFKCKLVGLFLYIIVLSTMQIPLNTKSMTIWLCLFTKNSTFCISNSILIDILPNN